MTRRRPPAAAPGRRAEAAPRLQDTVRLSADGLAKVLGDLEARVLRTVWDFGDPVPARAVYEQVMTDHPVSPLTVITVLNKLVDKGVLRRAKVGDLLHYHAAMPEADFIASFAMPLAMLRAASTAVLRAASFNASAAIC